MYNEILGAYALDSYGDVLAEFVIGRSETVRPTILRGVPTIDHAIETALDPKPNDATTIPLTIDAPATDITGRMKGVKGYTPEEMKAWIAKNVPSWEGEPAERLPNGHDPTPIRVNIKTLADLQHKVFPDLKELVPGLIVEGCLMLAGRPKLGKSWLTLDIGLAVAMGGKCFIDRQCVQGDVLYLALEDGDKRLQRRGSKLLPTFTGEWPANFHYATEWPRGADGLAEIEKWVAGHKEARLVVIDILAKFRTPTSSKRGTYEQDYEALSGLQHLAQKYQITVIVVHHTRKAAGEDPVDEISGTLGIAGAADAFMVIKAEAGKNKTMVIRGRDIEEKELAVKFAKGTCKWEILGDPEMVNMNEGQAKVLTALKQMGAPMSPKELQHITGLDKKTIENHLVRMLHTDQVEKAERGQYQPSGGFGDAF